MIRTPTLIGLSAALLAATSASAADKPLVGPLAHTFGNTIVSTYPDGRQGELWLKADGSYTAHGRRGDPSSGHWTLKAAKLCLKQSSPLPSPFSFCTPVPDRGMGASWTAKAVTGEAITVKVVKGRYLGHPRAG